MGPFKILINVPVLSKIGGKANYFSAIKDYFSNDAEYFTYGSLHSSVIFVDRFYNLLKDYFQFYTKLRSAHFHLVHLNPSLEPRSFFRDSIYLIIAKLLNVKVVVFFHGWSAKFEKLIDSWLAPLMKKVYFHADAIIVLASDYKKKLIDWGYKGHIFLETTVVDNALIAQTNIQHIENKQGNNEFVNLLFLARMEKAKGIYETLDCYYNLKQKYPYLRLIIAGHGKESNRVSKYIKERKILDVEMLGFITGDEKVKTFQRSNIYLFPSTHGEGLPLSLLEAMAMGLPIVTSRAGGIKDFFINEKMGYALDDVHIQSFQNCVINLIENQKQRLNISLYNHHYAVENYSATKVCKRLESIYKQIM